MKLKIIAIASLLAVYISVSAQEKDSNKISYSNITEWGHINLSVVNNFGFALEVTTVHGISIDKKHHIGLGTGIGFDFASIGGYSPLFLNYRICFIPNRTFSPHLNVSFGGLFVQDYFADYAMGIYSSVTSGFVAGKFSFSSGLSFFAANHEFMTGVVIKCGFIF